MVTILEYFQEGHPGSVIQWLQTELIDEKELVLHDAGQLLEIGTVGLCCVDFVEQPRRREVGDGIAVLTGLVAEG